MEKRGNNFENLDKDQIVENEALICVAHDKGILVSHFIRPCGKPCEHKDLTIVYSPKLCTLVANYKRG